MAKKQQDEPTFADSIRIQAEGMMQSADWMERMEREGKLTIDVLGKHGLRIMEAGEALGREVSAMCRAMSGRR